MISCPIDAIMDMGYECISPHEDLDNCGGCVSLGHGVSCERVAGVKRTECSRGRCINRKCHRLSVHTKDLVLLTWKLLLPPNPSDSCRSGWVLEKRSNTCIPRPRGYAYWLDRYYWYLNATQITLFCFYFGLLFFYIYIYVINYYHISFFIISYLLTHPSIRLFPTHSNLSLIVWYNF